MAEKLERRLERRLEVLERGMRRWKLAAASLAGVLLMAGLLGAATGPEKEIRTSRLVLVDERGRARAALAVNPDGMALIGLMDGARHTRASLYVAEDGVTGLSIADESQIPRIALELSKEGERASVTVLDAQERRRAELRVKKDGSPELRLSDASGQVLATLPEAGRKTAGTETP
jgi:hypothetical protein